ncbi:3-oxoacyl-[acyl-carrier-protein] synthase 2 [Longispora fulva]|uniref:3-oxoacyl-[acyl-carrier-protein] synthase 2 n=1 Tax=Longispora fulva TaxID=619741 RepID=A0A8J7GF52_9ACTN|nr:beta-ketoacyl-ACP synthase II [Longispora fulva]MBG6136445.1 3-oxoacyl-[acyl-carrier-protein] synthase II [Longispora fulva]GIG59612.1 3-oxoacyl-[acyl-carrier-protein] synthase 2 [Longispora fulva]
MTTRSDRRRVVITGTGVISPIGHGTPGFWAALLAGTSGVRTIAGFDASDLPAQIAGEVRGFEPDVYMERKVWRRIDPFAQYAIAAASEAVEAAKIEFDEELAARSGVLIGSGYGASRVNEEVFATLRDKGPRKIGPFTAASSAIDNAAGEVGIRFGITGPSGAISTACASGTSSIGESLRMIQHGYADVMLSGGSDDSVTRQDIASACSARALSTRNDEPERASRPFDTGRNGFVMAAGSGMVVLEEAGHALARGAEILAEVVGYGATSDAYHPTAPHPEGIGARSAIRQALADAGLNAEDVDYVNAHGTSTTLNDRTESAAIRAVLGAHAERIPISSTKSMTGHMIGAAGTVELIACVQAIRSGLVPPTINLDDPEDTGLNYVPHTAQERDVRVAISNSFGFAGHNAVVAVRRWQP